MTTRAEAYASGKAMRDACPRSSHAGGKAPAGRLDPVDLVLAAEEGRLPDLLPLRHGRMARSPFTFYRGAALTMAADLSTTPVSGLVVQCCGDAHLCKFGGFGTPERRVIFSINDLDETLPAPWEWDAERLAASFVVASRDNGPGEAAAKDAVRTCVRTYRETLSQARSGSSVPLSGYMGKSDAFDKAIASFSVAYADQNEKDHAALEKAIRAGQVAAVFEEEK